MSKHTIKSTIKYIDRILEGKQFSTFSLNWFGGEPLLCYENVMIPIALAAKESCEKNGVILESGITTNGYLIKEDMLPFFKKTNMTSFQITLDGKKEMHNTIRFTHDKKGSYDRIVNRIILIAKELNPSNLILRINYTLESIDGLHDIIESFPKELRGKIIILPRQVWQDGKNGKMETIHLQKMQHEFQNAGFKTSDRSFSRGYVCYADKFHQALINYDGRVFKCTAKNFEEAKEDGLLTEEGIIKWHHSVIEGSLKASFENEKCMKCKYLPVCYGFCSKIAGTLKHCPDDFDKYCSKSSIEDNLDFAMGKFKNTGHALSTLDKMM